jgi:predicted neutral ceramidase superfamily lipid hydrolase
MKAVFLVEKDTGRQNSLVVDAHLSNSSNKEASSTGVTIPQHGTIMQHALPTPSPSPDGRTYPKMGGLVREYVEMWDYVGSTRFRGFVAEKEGERSLFIFFDREVIGKDLKPG